MSESYNFMKLKEIKVKMNNLNNQINEILHHIESKRKEEDKKHSEIMIQQNAIRMQMESDLAKQHRIKKKKGISKA